MGILKSNAFGRSESKATRDLYGCDLVLVRPDQYVAWRGNAPPSDPERMFAQISGAA